MAFGWPGDGGLGERLIRQMLDETRTATCSPEDEYAPDELAEFYAAVGKPYTLVGVDGRARGAVLVTEVFETTFGDPDPRLVWGAERAAAGRPLAADTILVAELFAPIDRPSDSLDQDAGR